MPCPDAHYTLLIINHKTGEQLKVELVDLPFPAPVALIRIRPMAHLSGFPSMSHHTLRAPFASGSTSNGHARFRWRARRWSQNSFGAGWSNINQHQTMVCP